MSLSQKSIKEEIKRSQDEIQNKIDTAKKLIDGSYQHMDLHHFKTALIDLYSAEEILNATKPLVDFLGKKTATIELLMNKSSIAKEKIYKTIKTYNIAIHQNSPSHKITFTNHFNQALSEKAFFKAPNTAFFSLSATFSTIKKSFILDCFVYECTGVISIQNATLSQLVSTVSFSEKGFGKTPDQAKLASISEAATAAGLKTAEMIETMFSHSAAQ